MTIARSLLIELRDELRRDPDLAAELRALLLGVSAPDELLDRAKVEARYPIRFRVLTDAAKRGEITIEHAGRKPVVRKSQVEAWISGRATKPTIAKCANDARDDRAEARASVARSAARMGR